MKLEDAILRKIVREVAIDQRLAIRSELVNC